MTDEKWMKVFRTAAEIACTLFTTWQVAKMTNPELVEYETMIKWRLKEMFGKKQPKTVTQSEADLFVAEITKWVRENNDGRD